jgi:hypothetical protein
LHGPVVASNQDGVKANDALVNPFYNGCCYDKPEEPGAQKMQDEKSGEQLIVRAVVANSIVE